MRFILSLLSLTALIACSEPASEPLPNTSTPIPVKVTPVSLHTASKPITATGTLASKEEMRLSFKISGIINTVSVEESDHVQKGQILAQLDLDEIQARVTQAQSALEKAQRDLKRAQTLHKDQVVTLEQVQNATTAYNVAAADLRVAHFNLKHATIRAPSAGRILKRLAERRELITPGTPIFLISSTEQNKILRLSLTDREIVQIQLGDTATVTFDPYPNQTFSATISEIAESANPRTGTFEIELTLTNATNLKTGFIGYATITPSARAEHYRIPISAIVEANRTSAIIYTPNPDGQTAHRLMVHPTAISSDHITIPKSPNLVLTQVITEGAPYLTDQSPIVIQ